MSTLLAFVILTTISLAQGAKIGCSKYAEHAKLYNKAVKIASWEPSRIPKIRLAEDSSVQDIVDLIVEYKESYENRDNEMDCDKGLCGNAYLVGDIVSHPKQWAKIPQKYRLILEDFADRTNLYVYNLLPQFCKKVLTKIHEIANKVKAFPKLDHSKYSGTTFEGNLPDFAEFIELFEAAEKSNCARMFHLGKFSTTVWRYRIDNWETVPDKQLTQIEDFVKFSEQIFEELAKLRNVTRCPEL